MNKPYQILSFFFFIRGEYSPYIASFVREFVFGKWFCRLLRQFYFDWFHKLAIRNYLGVNKDEKIQRPYQIIVVRVRTQVTICYFLSRLRNFRIANVAKKRNSFMFVHEHARILFCCG